MLTPWDTEVCKKIASLTGNQKRITDIIDFVDETGVLSGGEWEDTPSSEAVVVLLHNNDFTDALFIHLARTNEKPPASNFSWGEEDVAVELEKKTGTPALKLLGQIRKDDVLEHENEFEHGYDSMWEGVSLKEAVHYVVEEYPHLTTRPASTASLKKKGFGGTKKVRAARSYVAEYTDSYAAKVKKSLKNRGLTAAQIKSVSSKISSCQASGMGAKACAKKLAASVK